MVFPLGQCPAPPDNIVIENAEFVYKPNFEGREERYNEAGDRYFNVLIPDNIVEAVIRDGWNVKHTKPGKEHPNPEEFVPRPFLEVAVGFRYRPPQVTVIQDGKETHLTVDEKAGIDTVKFVDAMEFERFDVVIRGRNWENDSGCGIKAWLKTFVGIVEMDDIQRKYAHVGE